MARTLLLYIDHTPFFRNSLFGENILTNQLEHRGNPTFVVDLLCQYVVARFVEQYELVLIEVRE